MNLRPSARQADVLPLNYPPAGDTVIIMADVHGKVNPLVRKKSSEPRILMAPWSAASLVACHVPEIVLESWRRAPPR